MDSNNDNDDHNSTITWGDDIESKPCTSQEQAVYGTECSAPV